MAMPVQHTNPPGINYATASTPAVLDSSDRDYTP